MATTKARTPAGTGAGSGTGAETLDSSTQVPTALVFDEVPGVMNSMSPGIVHYDIIDGTLFSGTCETTSDSFEFKFTAADNGRIAGIMYMNGAVAADSDAGWELDFTNSHNGGETVAYFGFGSGTEAAKATDKDVLVAANTVAYVSNSLTADSSKFTRGDVIEVVADADSSNCVGSWRLIVSYESKGTD